MTIAMEERAENLAEVSSEPEALFIEVMRARQSARELTRQAADAENVARFLEGKLLATMSELGLARISDDDWKVDCVLVVRRDVRIVDQAEVAAALLEKGLTVPTTDPKIDTIALKQLAKALGDLPGVEPVTSTHLKFTGHSA